MIVAVSTLAAGLACPILGAIADKYGYRKAITYVTGALSVVFLTIFAYSSGHWPWQELLAVIGLGMMFTSIMHCFYNSLLMMVSRRHDMIKVLYTRARARTHINICIYIGLIHPRMHTHTYIHSNTHTHGYM
jgi:MFS-type transporter involved in bile tolerance (Atg22 family)